VLAFRQRTLEVPHRVVVAVDRAVAEEQEGSRPCTLRQGVELGDEQFRQPHLLPGHVQEVRQREEPVGSRVRVLGEAQGMLGKDDRVLPCAPPAGGVGGRRDLRSEGVVRRVRGEREVEGAQLLVGNDARELEMEGAPLGNGRFLPGRGGEKGVGGPHVLAVGDEEADRHRSVERCWVADRS
jgi:hypothetical protein